MMMGAKTLRSSLLQLWGNIWMAVMTFISASVIARILGVEKYGLFSYTVAYVYIFLFVSKVGVDSVLNRELSRSKSLEHSQRMLMAAFRIQFFGALLAYGIMLLSSCLTEPDPVIRKGVAVLGLVFFTRLPQLFQYVYNSSMRGGVIAIAKCCTVTLGTIGKILCLYLGYGIEGVLWVMVFEGALTGLIYLLGKPGVCPSKNKTRGWQDEKYLLRSAWPLFLSSGAVVLYQRVDMMMLKSMAGFEEVGHYAVGIKFFTLINLIPSSLASALSPELFKSKDVDRDQYLKNAQIFLDICFWSTFFPCLLYVFLAHSLVPLLFGPSYLPAVYLSQIIVWRALFTGMGLGTGQIILAENLQHLALFRTSGGVLINVFLNLLWIPSNGAVGAAYATLFSFLVANWFMHAMVPQFRPLWRMQIRTLIYGPKNLFVEAKKSLIKYEE